MSRLQRVLVLLLFADSAAFADPTAPARDASRAITLGILREDAVLVPFARFDGRSWLELAWGVEIEEPQKGTAPRRFADVPPTRWGGGEPVAEWELVRANGARQRVTTAGLRDFQNHCGWYLGLATDYVSRVEVEPHTFPVPYAGIVASVPSRLIPVREIAKTSHDFRRVDGMLPALFARLEPDVWQEKRGATFEPLLDGTLPPPKLEGAYSSVLPDGHTLLTFHARRELPRRSDGQVELATAVVGWLSRREASPLTLLDARGWQSNNSHGETALVPRAALSIGEQTFWIGNRLGYEYEWFVVEAVGRGWPTEVLSVDAGGC